MALLNDVYIADLYSACAVYAVRRTGQFTVTELIEGWGERFVSWDKLLVGDVPVWLIEDYKSFDKHPTCIIGNRLITTYMQVDRHIGVYEGNGIVSDLTFVENSKTIVPCLRMRQVENLRYPNFFFRNPINNTPDSFISANK